jgi:hypothetical protein
MNRVKYTRREYREEYLRSDEWRTLRAKVIGRGTICHKCRTAPATDVHHTCYRNIVDVRPFDLVPLCRTCHNAVERAIKLFVLPKRHNRHMIKHLDLSKITKVDSYKKTKRPMSEALAGKVSRLSPDGRKIVCGIIKRLPPNDWMSMATFRITGAQRDHILWAIRHFGNLGSLQDSRRQRKKKINNFRNGVTTGRWPMAPKSDSVTRTEGGGRRLQAEKLQGEPQAGNAYTGSGHPVQPERDQAGASHALQTISGNDGNC